MSCVKKPLLRFFLLMIFFQESKQSISESAAQLAVIYDDAKDSVAITLTVLREYSENTFQNYDQGLSAFGEFQDKIAEEFAEFIDPTQSEFINEMNSIFDNMQVTLQDGVNFFNVVNEEKITEAVDIINHDLDSFETIAMGMYETLESGGLLALACYNTFNEPIRTWAETGIDASSYCFSGFTLGMQAVSQEVDDTGDQNLEFFAAFIELVVPCFTAVNQVECFEEKLSDAQNQLEVMEEQLQTHINDFETGYENFITCEEGVEETFYALGNSLNAAVQACVL